MYAIARHFYVYTYVTCLVSESLRSLERWRYSSVQTYIETSSLEHNCVWKTAVALMFKKLEIWQSRGDNEEDTVFCGVMPCPLTSKYRRFGGDSCPRRPCLSSPRQLRRRQKSALQRRNFIPIHRPMLFEKLPALSLFCWPELAAGVCSEPNYANPHFAILIPHCLF